MALVTASYRCKDCKHCSTWKTDRHKASCNLHHEEGFHPDRGVPEKCVGKVGRAY